MKKYYVGFALLALVLPLTAGAFSIDWSDSTVNYLLTASEKNETTPSTTPLSASKQKEVWSGILEEQGNLLLQQAKKLRTSLGSESSKGTCLDLKNSLVMGSTDAATGGEVSRLQKFLKDNGFFPSSNVTGYYGTLTADAVVKFQNAMGMDFVTKKSGVGPLTRGHLREYCKQSTGTFSGVYSFSDMSGFAYFRTDKGPSGRAAAIVWGESDKFGRMTVAGKAQQDIFGTMSPIGDSCTIERDVTLRLNNLTSLGYEPGESGYELWSGEYAGVVSLGTAYDSCYVSPTVGTERKARTN